MIHSSPGFDLNIAQREHRWKWHVISHWIQAQGNCQYLSCLTRVQPSKAVIMKSYYCTKIGIIHWYLWFTLFDWFSPYLTGRYQFLSLGNYSLVLSSFCQAPPFSKGRSITHGFNKFCHNRQKHILFVFPQIWKATTLSYWDYMKLKWKNECSATLLKIVTSGSVFSFTALRHLLPPQIMDSSN